MPSAQWNDLRSFREFLENQLETGGDSLTLDDVLARWDYETQSDEEREATIAAIQHGLDDMHAGRTVDAFEALARIREKLNLKSR